MSSATSPQPVALSADEKKRFEEMFQKLDKNRDGKIEVRELAESLKSLQGVTDVDKHAQVKNLNNLLIVTNALPLNQTAKSSQ